MSDHELPILRRELARHRAISAAMLAALEKFAAHYPHGVNPDLDEAYGDARAAIAQAEAAGITAED